MLEDHLLSKSTFLRGANCKKSLYLDRFHRELRDLQDPAGLRRMQEGQVVGELARDLFPGGELARTEAPFDFTTSLTHTQNLIETNVPVLYEAAIQHDQVLTFIDILVREDDGWILYEVKSTNEVKEHHYLDVALQVFLLKESGFLLKDAYLIHLNREYQREGDLDLENLFSKVPVLREALELQPHVEEEIERCKEVLAESSVPEIDIGPYCDDPVRCDFKGHCWVDIPELSVFNVYRLVKKKKFDLYYSGVVHIEEIPESYPLSDSSRFHVSHHKSGQSKIDQGAIREFIGALHYPVYFLDFETFMTAIPPFDGLGPHAQVPYQYSLHVLFKPGEVTTHSGFLAEAGTDPRTLLVEQLLKETDGSGDILAYNMSFEKRIFRELSESFPVLKDALQNRIDRLKDLMKPFQKRHYYTPDMHGSASLKSVLPALVPELNYEDLEISDGLQAMEVYLALSQDTDVEKIQLAREMLWDYCKRDTLAMVRIQEELEKAVT